MARNPFKPSAGSNPPLLVGRETVLEELEEAIEDGPGAPGLLQFVTGARGVGKTVMLTAMGDIARRHGWIVVDDTATPGMLERLTEVVHAYRQEIGSPDRSQVTAAGVSVLGVSAQVQRQVRDEPLPSLRSEISQLCDALRRRDGETGLLITVDEVHTMPSAELDDLAAVTQHLIREERPIGLLMAGIPQAVEELISDNPQRPKVSTFLRRAERTALLDVPYEKVAEAFEETIRDSGRSISPERAMECARATGGYPFMIQLVGYHTWRLAKEGEVTSEHVALGWENARKRLGKLVHDPAIKDLSPVDRTFLMHMSKDDGPSKVGDIRSRMDVADGYVGMYRSRLIRAGMIRPANRHGYVEFALPELRSYLREHAAQLVTSPD